MQPRPLADLPNRDTLDPVQPPDLRPLLHTDQPSSSPIANDPTRVRTRPDTTDPTPGGSLLSRRRWVTIQSAPTINRTSPPQRVQVIDQRNHASGEPSSDVGPTKRVVRPSAASPR